MVEYQRYPEYKDSGVEWLGEIPARWSTKPLKKNIDLVSKKGDDDFTLALENIESWTGKLIGYFDKEYETTGILFEKNDILFGKLRPYLAKVWRADSSGSAVGDFYVIRGRKSYNSSFLRYILASKLIIDVINSSTYGAKMPRVNWSFMGNMQVPLPPLATQQKIVEFLDKETAHIDAGIANMESLIGLLTEKRAALISETVTRGIPSEHTEFKDSGVDWLGEIPAGWNKVSFGSLFERTKTLGNGDEELLSVYREHGVIPKSSRNDNHNVASEDLSKYQIVRKNNLVINKMKAWQGSLAISEYDGIVSPAYFVFKSKKENSNHLKFLHYLMRSNNYKGFYHSISKGIRLGQWDLDQKSHKSMPILIPKVSEQKEIVEFIEKELMRIESLIKEANSTISLMKEKRQKLISEVVTGKICVE